MAVADAHPQPPSLEGSATVGVDATQKPEAPPPACTTLCLWEPDPALMIRRAKGQERARKSEYAAEERKGAFNTEATSTEEIRAFEEHFALEIRAARDTMQELVDTEAADAGTPAKLQWALDQHTELHSLISGTVHFLPFSTREKFVKQVAEEEAKLKEQRGEQRCDCERRPDTTPRAHRHFACACASRGARTHTAKHGRLTRVMRLCRASRTQEEVWLQEPQQGGWRPRGQGRGQGASRAGGGSDVRGGACASGGHRECAQRHVRHARWLPGLSGPRGRKPCAGGG